MHLNPFGAIGHLLPSVWNGKSGATAGTYGDATHVAQVTVDAYGRVTAVVNVAISGGGGSSPLTTKGDVWIYSTADARLPVGTDGYVLTANSLVPEGVQWIARLTIGDTITGSAAAHNVLYADASRLLQESHIQADTTRLSFFGATLVTQQSTTGTNGTVVAGGGGGSTDLYSDTTNDGGLGGNAYTFGDVVLAMKTYGLLA